MGKTDISQIDTYPVARTLKNMKLLNEENLVKLWSFGLGFIAGELVALAILNGI